MLIEYTFSLKPPSFYKRTMVSNSSLAYCEPSSTCKLLLRSVKVSLHLSALQPDFIHLRYFDVRSLYYVWYVPLSFHLSNFPCLWSLCQYLVCWVLNETTNQPTIISKAWRLCCGMSVFGDDDVANIWVVWSIYIVGMMQWWDNDDMMMLQHKCMWCGLFIPPGMYTSVHSRSLPLISCHSELPHSCFRDDHSFYACLGILPHWQCHNAVLWRSGFLSVLVSSHPELLLSRFLHFSLV